MGEPLLQNYYVFIDLEKKFYKVTSIEPFEYRTGEEATAIFSAVAADGESGFKNITTLEPDDIPKHLFQVRMGVKYGFRYYWKIPTGTNRFGTDEDKAIGFLDNYMSPFDDPNEDFEIWLIKEFYPAVNAKNKTSVTLTPQIYFTGFKYDIEQVTEPDVLIRLNTGLIPYKKITIGGVKT